MDRLCSIIVVLLLTAGGFSRALQEKWLNAHLEPNYINVCHGDSVTINCTFQPSGKYKVSWHYSQTPILGCSSAYKIPEEQRFLREKSEDWSTLNITFIKANESGWYFCKVTQDIPVLMQICSNGIQVIVDAPSTSSRTRTTESQDQMQNQTTGDLPTCMTNGKSTVTTISTLSSTPSSSFTQWWIWLALAVGCVVLLVSIIVICILSRKPKETIYENTKPVESSCWRRNRTKMDICDLPASKKTDTIKPLRKYDTLSSNRIRRP